MRAKSPRQKEPVSSPEGLRTRVFTLLFGVFIGLSLLKFGNPCLFDKSLPPPENLFEWVLNTWPVKIGYFLLGAFALAGLFARPSKPNAPRWVLVMPVIWLGWQFISATQTIDALISRPTLAHFTSCVVCFYIGAFCLSRDREPLRFWVPVLCAMFLVVGRGFEQHFGGLESTRRYFFAYIYPTLENVSPEYLAKVSSNRIFSTLFYPNALAGVILLLLPPTLRVLWSVSERLSLAARRFVLIAYGTAALACLLWSGSKGGWLLALLMGLIALFHVPFAFRLKVVFVTLFVVVGVSGFAWKYSGFFEKGATSVHARFDYWRAAGQTVVAKPVFGTGPGTFGVAYKAIKRPESEMARLAHNDYLEQASDSGIIGFMSYLAWIGGIAWFGYSKPGGGSQCLRFCVWLGITGWLLQGLAEFGLYIPALAWTTFTLAGCLVSSKCRLEGPERLKTSDCTS